MMACPTRDMPYLCLFALYLSIELSIVSFNIFMNLCTFLVSQLVRIVHPYLKVLLLSRFSSSFCTLQL